MANSVIGAQIYTIRDHIKTADDLARSCQRLKEDGYEALQLSAAGPIDVQQIAKILQDNGLTCAATHVDLDEMKQTQQCADYHQALGCKYTAIGGHLAADREGWLAFTDDYNQIAQALGEHGIEIGYHHHSRELAPVAGESGGPGGEGSTILDFLIEHLDPAVWIEIDTYWIAHGGGDPAAWIDKVAGRLPCIHVKDMAVTTGQEQKMCEVGLGNLNWPSILAACERAGVQWYLVERDDGDMDPFESLKTSLQQLKAMGLS